MSPVAVAYSGLSAPIVRAEVALATAEELAPVVGSFAEGGMAFAIQPDGTAMLVAAGPDAAPEEAGDGASTLSIPASVEHGGATYEVAAIGAHALSLCGAATVAIPASVASIDEDALWPTAAERVEVDAANPTYASYDGILYDASLTRLLSIPEGRQGAVRIIESAQEVEASALSHSAGVDALCVDAGGAHLASWDGLLYTADGATLLRVPPAATDVAIRDGCTTVAPGALEGCAALERIEAPATVVDVSPSALGQSIPTAALPAEALAGHDEAGEERSQITSLVALSASGDDVPSCDPSQVTVVAGGRPAAAAWAACGFSVEGEALSEEAQPTADMTPEGIGEAPLAVAPSEAAAYAVDVPRYSVTVNIPTSITRLDVRYFTRVYTTSTNYYDTVTWTGSAAGGTSWSYVCCGLFIVSETSAFLIESEVSNEYGCTTQTIWEFAPITAAGYYVPSWRWLSSSYDLTFPAGKGTYLAEGGTFSPVVRGIQYTVTLSPNYAGGATTSVVATQGEAMPGIAPPSRAGYTFGGYYDTSAASGGLQYYTASGVSARAWDKASIATLYARWTGNRITLTWNSNGGSSVAATAQTYSDGAKVVLAGSPTRPGYTFAGWYTAASGGSQVTSSTALPTANTTYYAHWNANTITVTWNSNGGSAVGNTSKAYAAGATVPMPGSNPTRPGYTFAGWYTAASGGSQVTSSTALPTSNPTYYAHWNANTITLTWNSNGGSAVGNTSKTYASGATVPMPGSNPTRAGYAFAGWYTAASGGSQVTSSTALPTANATYYAHWNANTITVTWNSNGGSAVASTSRAYAESAKVPMPSSNPTRVGYTFAGWWTAASGGTQVTSSTALPTSNPTYYAHWSLNPYEIAYELDGGTVSGNPTTYSVETVTFTLKNPTRTGYTFAGWSGTDLSGNANMAVRIEKGSTGNRFYTAHWQRNAYEVEYCDRSGAVLLSVDDGFAYDVARALAPKPTEGLTPGYTALGWAESPNQASASYGFGSLQVNLATGASGDMVKRLYLAEAPNQISITWESEGDVFARTQATYDPNAKVPMPAAGPEVKPGWAFKGWWTQPNGSGEEVTAETPLPTEDATYHAHWVVVVAVDAPLRVTVSVDMFGIEDQKGGEGYLESRSGAPLKVSEVSFVPLEGAVTLFGSHVQEVSLEARAEASSSPDISFSLDAAGSEMSTGSLAPFALAGGYGSRVGIGYRFAIPDDVLASIDRDRFSEVTTPVGQVRYTVAVDW